jgi:hypothetical protein
MKTQSTLDGFECLEDRLLLAGDVAGSVVGGTLFLTGDGLDNWFEIQQFEPTAFLVIGRDSPGPGGTLAPTTINGMASEVFGGVTNFRVKGNGGDEMIFFNGDTGQGGLGPITIPGFVDVKGNNGTDNILYDGVTIRRKSTTSGNDGGDTIQFIDSRVKEKLVINGGNQGDTIATIRSTFDSTAVIKGGSGPDRVFLGLQQGSLEGATFKSSLNVNLGGNRNFFESTESTFLGITKIRGGGQKDDFDINNSDFKNKTLITTSGGNDLVEINDTLFRDSSFKLVTGSGRDKLRVFDSRFDTDSTQFLAGSDNDNFSFNDSFFTGLVDGRAFRGGAGNLDRLNAGLFGADNNNVFAGGSGKVDGWEKAT